MLPLQFFGQNIHFALNLFFSLIAFATFWLYFDSWLEKKRFKEVFKWLGFLLVSISFLIHATTIEQTVLGKSLFGNFSEILGDFVQILGYISILISLFAEPLQQIPHTEGIKTSKGYLALFSLSNIKFLLPVGSLAIALLYYRRATKGLERHLLPIAFAFFFLSLSDSLSLASLLRNNPNINIANATAAFGPIWIIEQFFLLFAAVILGRWVWSYLLKRLQSQMFMILTTSVLIIFLIVSVSFTFLLVGNIQKDTLSSLKTSAKVLNYALDSKKSEVGLVAEVFSSNKDIVTAAKNKDHAKLLELVSSSLENKKLSSLIITNAGSQVLFRAEQPDSWGDSLSSDPVVKKTLLGEQTTNFVVSPPGVLAPIINIQASRPLFNGSEVVGTVIASLAISNSFLDNIKSSSGLDVAIFAGNTRSATTIVAPNGKDRFVGVKEENSQVKDQVLSKGNTFSGSLPVLNRPFLAVYEPLKNINNDIVGMTFTGEPQVLILQDSGKSIELTFLIAAVLLLISVVPSYLISKYIAKQLH